MLVRSSGVKHARNTVHRITTTQVATTITNSSNNNYKQNGINNDNITLMPIYSTSFQQPYNLQQISTFSSTTSTTDDEEEHPNFDENQAAYQRLTEHALVHELTRSQEESAATVVPWFLDQMPSSYFRTVNEESRMNHLRAITTLHDSRSHGTVVLRSTTAEDRNEITFIRPGNYPGMLTEMLDQLPPAGSFLSRVKVFTSKDNSLALNIFGYGRDKEACPELDECNHIFEYAKSVQKGELLSDPNAPSPHPSFEEAELQKYIKQCTAFFVKNSHPRRFLIHRKLFESVKGTETVVAHLEKYTGEVTSTTYTNQRYWISLAMGNILPHIGLQKAAILLGANDFDLLRVHLDLVEDPDNKTTVTMLRILVHDQFENKDDNNKGLDEPGSSRWAELKKDLCRLKWLDNSTIDLGVNNMKHGLSMENAEIITALSNIVHGPLSKRNRHAYTTTNIHSDISNRRYLKHAIEIADLFRDRFDPKTQGLSDKIFEERSEKIRSTINSEVEESRVSVLLNKMVDVVHATYRTNLFMPNRYALGLRINPSIMNGPGDEDRDAPYGVFYVHGRRFNGFHCRFREIARGGLRIVTPPTAEAVASESSRHYDEVYGLSYAQQLKNKDIPEGGSKGVILCDVHSLTPNGVEYSKRKAVKAFNDAMLDLIVDTTETQANIVDLWGKQEILYFGPDEQIIPEDINWVIKRAGERGYPIPSAYMSSKPDAGINHKVYGVTSEGVAVFLKHGLLKMGIDPKKEKFTIKLTGGPDGDVTGNMIKIIDREYGDNAVIVGITDGTGCAEDPNGLDHEELLRLFNQEAGIVHYDQSKLSSEAKFYTLDTDEGIRMRNTMHNRLKADAFVPGGGRPYTINHLNWKDYLLPDGTPSSKLIVEGANLFLTKEARENLHKHGVQIVKDSSANKCGVICSSFEIVSCMLLNQTEFTDIKDELVNDVLDKLKNFAEQEAELLFRELENQPNTYLPDYSMRISDAMNLVKDAVAKELENCSEEEFEQFYPILKAHLPDILAEKAFDRFKDNVPFAYAKNIISSSLATKIVYREGVSFIEEQGVEGIAKNAFKYVEEEKAIAKLKEQLMEGDLDSEAKDIIYQILDKGGIRTKLNMASEN